MSCVITQPITLRLDLDPEYGNGTDALIGSDESWKRTTDGPTRFNGILAGETYDARREMACWAGPGFDDSKWKSAKPAFAPGGRLVSQQLRPARCLRQLPAMSVTKEGAGWCFDLGVETAGRARLRLKGKSGQTVTTKMPGSDSHTLGRYQTCQLVSLVFGLVSDDQREHVRQRLAERVNADNGHLTTATVYVPATAREGVSGGRQVRD